MRRKILGVLLAVAFGLGMLTIAAPTASADCTDLGGQGQLCTTGDPATGSFGIGLHAPPLNVCVVINASCP